MDGGDIVIARALSKSVDGLCLFQDISFTLRRGEVLLITGPNGSGKTTLLSILAGLDKPNSGEIVILGKNMNRLRREESAGVRACCIGFALQEPVLINTLSVLDNIALAAVIAGLDPRDALARSRNLLERLGLLDKAGEKAGKLSGGERKRVELARALVKNPKLLLLDEPLSMLDTESMRLVIEVLRTYLDKGGAIIAAMPEMEHGALSSIVSKTLRLPSCRDES